MGDDAARLAFKVSDHILVAHIENSTRGQHTMPMCHQALVMPIISAELGQIVSEVLFCSEHDREAGKAGVNRIANDVNDGGVRQRQMNEAGKNEILRQFISDTIGAGGETSIAAT